MWYLCIQNLSGQMRMLGTVGLGHSLILILAKLKPVKFIGNLFVSRKIYFSKFCGWAKIYQQLYVQDGGKFIIQVNFEQT